MRIYVITAATVLCGAAHMFGQEPATDAISINTLVNAVGAVLLGVVAWFVQLGVRRALDRLDRIGRRVRRVEVNQLLMAQKLKIKLPHEPDDEPNDDTDLDDE